MVKINRRQFLTAAAGVLAGYAGIAGAGSITLEDLNKLRIGGQKDAGSDAALLEKLFAQRYWELLTSGKAKEKLVQNNKAHEALERIAEPIFAVSTRKKLNWRIGLSDSKSVNACTPGGGVIIINHGLIKYCSKESELASVIAHETGHVEHRHAIRRLMSHTILEEYSISLDFEGINNAVSAVEEVLYQSFTRLWEHEADAFIIRSFLQTGYPVNQASLFFHTMNKLYGKTKADFCIFATHPDNCERIQRLEALASTYETVQNRPDSKAFNYLKSI